MILPTPLIERATLERMERLAVRWQRSFNGLLGGHNRSRSPGAGQEFLDHRHFHQGDDVRSVNWLAYMRLERLFLKMFQIEPRVPVRILLDTSESMACGASGGRGEAKFVYACRLAAMLCYVGLVRLDTILLQPFSNSLPKGYTAQGGRHRFAPAMQFLGGLETGGRSDFHAVVRQFLAPGTARGLMILLSDFLDATEQRCETAMQHLADYGHELMLVHIAGPEDSTPPWRGECEMVDAESGEMRRLEIDQRSADAYTAAYEEFCNSLRRVAQRNGGRYVPLSTVVAAEDAVFGSLVEAGAIGMRG